MESSSRTGTSHKVIQMGAGESLVRLVHRCSLYVPCFTRRTLYTTSAHKSAQCQRYIPTGAVLLHSVSEVIVPSLSQSPSGLLCDSFAAKFSLICSMKCLVSL